MMIERDIEPRLKELATRFPVVTLTGPRQSGKTTLCKMAFPNHDYVSLERPDRREFAHSDPLGFLAGHSGGLIIDEVQWVPELLSYIQVEVDESRVPGRFILTGSQNFGLMSKVSQSLAGRTGLLTLLPTSLRELRRFPKPADELGHVLWKGSYPAIHDLDIPADEWLAQYVGTYVERDVRSVLEIRDLRAFQTFLTLCAGRTGQVVNVAGLAADAGVAHGTAKAWLSVLEASHIIMLLPAWHGNFSSRFIKSAKLHFIDTGLACWLLRIRRPADVMPHHARGAIFESWVAGEIVKARLNHGKPIDSYHVRTRKREELDFLVETAARRIVVEVKSGSTVVSDLMRGLRNAERLVGNPEGKRELERVLVYGGEETQRRQKTDVVPWLKVDGVDWVG
jgi:uncharacterized protein